REESVLRTSLIPSLLVSASHHARHKMETLRIFELRTVFQPKGSKGSKEDARPVETRRIAGLLMGSRLGSHWSGGVQKTDFYDIKGIVERLTRSLGRENELSFSKSSISYLHPGQQASVALGGHEVGCVGEVHPDILAKFELRKAAYVFELDWGG